MIKTLGPPSDGVGAHEHKTANPAMFSSPRQGECSLSIDLVPVCRPTDVDNRGGVEHTLKSFQQLWAYRRAEVVREYFIQRSIAPEKLQPVANHRWMREGVNSLEAWTRPLTKIIQQSIGQPSGKPRNQQMCQWFSLLDAARFSDGGVTS